ncbi:MAG: superinfection immunity protein [Microlunatus sp.]|nr:superinfection immunity protein [Microlunatus sp.]MDN5805266.1 superinfection immunity protein [Microlunatus sp.]
MSYRQPYGPHGSVHTQVVSQPYRSSTAHVVIAWVLTVLTVGYLLPWAIAATRNKANTATVALINIFLGWSLVGWIVALVMSLTTDPQPVIYVNTAVLPSQHPAYGQPAPHQLPQQGYGYQQPSHLPYRHEAGEPTAILPPFPPQSWRPPNPGPGPQTHR